MNPALLALIAAQQAGRQRIVDAFERAGATSPATARPLGSLGELDEGALRACVEEGTIREGAPGTFYLWRTPVEERRPYLGPGRIVKLLSFWLIVVLIPIVFLYFNNR